ncbi:hypothetical protein KVR01_009730 [Diaporthe batatas]|uniref:uncharacterized protein n=1 Tax=Diaporthe batatas TaxID=748121 RepID=UPI001D036864|nr:uncharacterized protein KVR01_009730 [Diaporthe batatas]KAG8160194.1 hypothetical protein KVR01_009730 [Diaporthe batatas]
MTEIIKAQAQAQAPPREEEAVHLEEVTETPYLSPLATTSTEDLPSQERDPSTQAALSATDHPSMYMSRGKLRTTCFDAAAGLQRTTTRGDDTKHNLPWAPKHHGTRLRKCDVRQHTRRTAPSAPRTPGALHRATRVAIELPQLWPDIMARLAGDG